MNNVSQHSNLFIDESGRHYIGDSYTRFFALTGIILNTEERLLANLLLKKWRLKYWNDSLKSFHAVDFFENRKNLCKKELVMKKNFDRASKELLELISRIEFESRTYYIDKIQTETKKLTNVSFFGEVYAQNAKYFIYNINLSLVFSQVCK